MSDTYTPTADDRLIWSLSTGNELKCKKDLVMVDDGITAFRKGHTYVVASVHPICDPSRVKLIDEQLEDHYMYAENLREFFEVGATA